MELELGKINHQHAEQVINAQLSLLKVLSYLDVRDGARKRSVQLQAISSVCTQVVQTNKKSSDAPKLGHNSWVRIFATAVSAIILSEMEEKERE